MHALTDSQTKLAIWGVLTYGTKTVSEGFENEEFTGTQVRHW